jgi:PLP dependent protein
MIASIDPSILDHRAGIAANYQLVLEQIRRAATDVSRNPDEVRLVVVTKGHPVLALQQAYEAGVHVFGENYAEEGVAKRLALAGMPDVEWHMIGHVQSRKASLVSENFDWLHSLDSLKLAARLDRFCAGLGRRLPVLLECNVSGEETKSGFPAWQESRWVDLAAEFARIGDFGHLEVRGLMTMAPFLPDPEQARPYFQRLRSLRQFLQERLPQLAWRELSMGMSADFQVAVQEGATLVRVGTAIMGPRPADTGL